MQPGDKVQVVRPTGEVVIDNAVVVRWAGGDFVFVEGDGPEGRALYGVPTTSVVPEVKPSPRVVGVLRSVFGLREITGGK